MFDWLFEGRPTVYAALGVFAIILGALWWRDRRRAWLYALGGIALLAIAYLLLDQFVETRNEQIARRLATIQTAVKAGNAERIMEQFSTRFSYRGISRDRFRAMVQNRLKNRFLDDLTIWDVRIPDASGKVSFKAKPKGSTLPDNPGFVVRAEFAQDSDGQWRMLSFEVYHPMIDSETPLDVSPYIQ